MSRRSNIMFGAIWDAFPDARGAVSLRGRALVKSALCGDFSQSAETTEEGIVYTDAVMVRYLRGDDVPALSIGAVVEFVFRRGTTHTLRIHSRTASGGIVRLTCEAVAK